MPESAPIYCRPHAFELFAAQVPFLDERRGLLKAAIAMSMHELDDVEPAFIDEKLESAADLVRSRVRSGNRAALLAHLHDVLFDQMNLRGNEDDYYNPVNSYIPAVVETGVGIPITLSLVYADVAARLELDVIGVNAPGHFLVALVEDGGKWTLVDPYFGGRIMSRAEALQRVRKIVPGSGEGEGAAHLLSEASHRQWLTRMLRNLMGVFKQQGRDADVAAMAELGELL